MAAKITEMFSNQSLSDTSQQEQQKSKENDVQDGEMTEEPVTVLENDEKEPEAIENDGKVPGSDENVPGADENVPGADENIPGTDENGKVPGSQEIGENVPGNDDNGGDVPGNEAKGGSVEAEENDIKEPGLNTKVRENRGKKQGARENADSFAFQDTQLYTKRSPVGRLDSYHKLGSDLKVSERNSMKDLGFQYAGHYIDELIKHVRGNLKDIEVEPRHDTTDAYYMRQGNKYIHIDLPKTNDVITKKYVNITKKPDKDINKNDKTTKKYDRNMKKDDKITKKNDKNTKKTDKITKKNNTTTKKVNKVTKNNNKSTKKDQKTTKKDDKSTNNNNNTTKKYDNITKKNDMKNTKESLNFLKKNVTTAKLSLKETITTRSAKVNLYRNLYRLVTALE